MKTNYKITILTDKTSWMNKYNLKLKQLLEKLGHCVTCINDINELSNGDIAFFLSCYKIVTQEYLLKNKHNIVVHASDLPKGKGWSPMTWQILEGKNVIPITIFEANEKCDAGNYYWKDVIELTGNELIQEWQEKLGEKVVDMCVKFVTKADKLKQIPQQGEESRYSKRCPNDSKLDINKTIKEQFNLLRVVDNEKYPAYFIYKNRVYTLTINSTDLEQ